MQKIKVLHTLGLLGLGVMEHGASKLVNKIDRAKFRPYIAATRDFDEAVRRKLATDVKFTSLDKNEGRDWRVVMKLV